MRADGSHVRQLTQRHPRANGPTGEDAEPQFSPDGMTLLGKPAASRARSTVALSAHIYDRGTDGGECRWARVLAYEPPNRIVFSWNISLQWQLESDPGKTSEVEVRFVAESAGRTRVELEHRHLDRHGEGWQERMRDAVASDGGWPAGLRRFADAIQT